MAKKNKSFSKNQLLSLYENQNYQKVVSKIKQFKISGMNDKELEDITFNAYLNLSIVNFNNGDLQRALREIDSAIKIRDDEYCKILKLKYLCYLEKFDEAMIFGEELLVSKSSKTKKEALFFYLLAQVYSGKTDLETSRINLLPQSRKNYILGFLEFQKGNIDLSLEFFEKSKPRLNEEKENLSALKAIISTSDFIKNESIKPLYAFLLFGEDQKLQNTKNVREIKNDIIKNFSQNSNNKAFEGLLKQNRKLSKSSQLTIINKDY
jgi:tetratricopeptide (TPR) repeat protein